MTARYGCVLPAFRFPVQTDYQPPGAKFHQQWIHKNSELLFLGDHKHGQENARGKGQSSKDLGACVPRDEAATDTSSPVNRLVGNNTANITLSHTPSIHRCRKRQQHPALPTPARPSTTPILRVSEQVGNIGNNYGII